jgi:NADPH-dependent glutamate synthase beta subunit-like oxidoreductase/Pyruvate/2-oxoacid:ferredoxin oxidoreductase delta subunit
VTGESRLTPSFRPSQVQKQPPCQIGCPNCGDIRGWIGTVAQRHKLGLSREEAYTRAWRMITDVNPFPSVLGRVCPHPCEAECNRGEVDEPLSINAMERFLGDWAIENAVGLERLAPGRHPETIGVIGAGPSGLSFAYQVARRGYEVTVYERRERAGGMLRYGIPDYRLPPAVLDAEIQRILDLGVELRTGVAVGRDVTLADLRERHDVLYVGIGAQKGRGLGLPGETGPGLWIGTEYMERVNRGETAVVGERVIVVGGGNTAVDAARTARRTGSEVTILYRRSRAEMPAIPAEIEEAEAEGVRIELLAAPVRVERAEDGDGKGAGITAVVARRMRLGEPDESGRRRPVPIEGSEFEIRADTLIAAVSQEPEWDGLGPDLGSEGSWLVAGEAGSLSDGVWAGGDVLGLGIAGNAIVQGRKAAETVHARLRGVSAPLPDSRPTIGTAELVPGFYAPTGRSEPAHLPPAEALARPDAETVERITEEAFLAEAARCFSCGSCFGCQQCWMYCTAGCFTAVEESGPGVFFTLSLDRCHECGKCAEVCPCGYLSVSETLPASARGDAPPVTARRP